MKLSKILLGAMSVALLSSCTDKSKNEVKPKEQTTQTNGENGHNNNGTPPDCCPACGRG